MHKAIFTLSIFLFLITIGFSDPPDSRESFTPTPPKIIFDNPDNIKLTPMELDRLFQVHPPDEKFDIDTDDKKLIEILQNHQNMINDLLELIYDKDDEISNLTDRIDNLEYELEELKRMLYENGNIDYY